MLLEHVSDMALWCANKDSVSQHWLLLRARIEVEVADANSEPRRMKYQGKYEVLYQDHKFLWPVWCGVAG